MRKLGNPPVKGVSRFPGADCEPVSGAHQNIVERRSPTRPQFIEGWRKALKRTPAPPQTAASPHGHPDAHIDIWVANPIALLRSESALKLVSESDWHTLNQIQDPRNRRSAIAARMILRIGLSQAADRRTPPSDWRFDRTEQGKPAVAAGMIPVNFSVSHVDELVVVAISPTIEIGVDVECIDQNIEKKVIAEFCHLDEHRSVGGFPRPQEIREFIRLWTLKEAYTKLVGVGHNLDFKTLEFTLDPVDLKPGSDAKRIAGTARFENFYASHKNALFNVSLAFRHAPEWMGSTQLQIISLACPEEKQSTGVVEI